MSRYERKYSAIEDAALITIIQAQARYNMGRDKVRGIAEEAHAIRKVGKSVLIVRSIMDDYLINGEEFLC